MLCIIAVLIIKSPVPTSQYVKDSSHGNKILEKLKIKINLRTKVKIFISTYSNAEVVCYSATCTSGPSYLNVGLTTVHHLYDVNVANGHSADAPCD